MLKIVTGLLGTASIYQVGTYPTNVTNLVGASSTNLLGASLTNPTNQCTSFTVSSGTGCAWMCNYCASILGTNNYYFTNSVCTYQSVGCVGNPIAGERYTCCAN